MEIPAINLKVSLYPTNSSVQNTREDLCVDVSTDWSKGSCETVVMVMENVTSDRGGETQAALL